MILFFIKMAFINFGFGSIPESLGVLLFAAALIGGAVGARRLLSGNEEAARDLLEKTIA